MARPGNDAGQRAEDQALAFLLGQGLTLLARNHRCRFGEIDLVMQDGEEVVFVEVRARRRANWGSAAASVTSGKQQRLLKTARHWLMCHGREVRCRFDLVSFDGCAPDASARYAPEWLRDILHESG